MIYNSFRLTPLEIGFKEKSVAKYPEVTGNFIGDLFIFEILKHR